MALGLVLLGLSLMLALAVWANFHQVRGERARHAGDSARLLETSITLTLESVEIALLELAERARDIAASGAQWHELTDAVNDTLQFSPHIRQILLAREDRVLFDSRQDEPDVRRLDRQRLALRAANAGGFNLGLRIGNPLPGRFLPMQGSTPVAEHSRILPVALAAAPADAAPVTVYAALNPRFFVSQFDLVEFGEHSGGALLGLDGAPLLSRPEFAGHWPGATAAALHRALQRGGESGFLALPGNCYPGCQIAYRLSSRYPLAVLILVDHRDTLAAWWRQNWALLLGSGLGVAGLVLGGVLLIRAIQRHFAIQDQVRRLLGQAVAQSATAVLVTDPPGNILYVNDAYGALSGFRPREVLGRPLASTLADSQAAPLWRDAAADTPWQGEGQIRTRDGRAIWVLFSVSPVRDDRGQIVHRVCTQVDISERKRAEEDLRIAAAVFESQEGMMVTDARGEIIRVNRAFSDLTGFSAADVLGRTPTVLHSGRQDPAFYRQMWAVLRDRGYWQGELWNRRRNGEEFPEWLTITAVTDNHEAVTHYVGCFTDISLRKAAEEKIWRLAFFDVLTGLPNRRMLLDRLHHALATSARGAGCGALVFIDLDNFKTLNDTQGHQVGDQLLMEVARRLGACVRETDTVARLGGDEFVVLLEALDRDRDRAGEQAGVVAGKILQQLGQPYRFADHQHQSGASIGVNVFHGHELAVDELLKRADMAMYWAKAAGRNNFRVFDPIMQAALEDRAALEQALRCAMPERQVLLYLQPQVDLQGRFIGAEALLRWQHPELGMVNPGDFIPLAEESGVIVPIGYWVISTACDYLRGWQNDPGTRDLSLAVNVSARQFRQADFVTRVLEIVGDSGIDPGRLKLELTESLMLHDTDETIVRMKALKERGIGLSLDDFGTGQSSLAYLKALPLDQLKIDRAFVQDLPHNARGVAVVQTIIALAQNLELQVIAEGVETRGQAAFLSQHGCQAFQGFLYGRPMPEAAFREALAGTLKRRAS